MATMNISLPDAMKDWVEQQVATGRYANSSDVMRDLVRREQERAGQLEDIGRVAKAALARGRLKMTREELLDHMQRIREEAIKQQMAS
ncbi:type II toxin-antitoxin system ParD family antitoxin [Devosia aurantiaca]|uniref:Type II toxin-antitoxin system ParD family antitoxin n=1 Tax=Devosia aurantiaca TaxID=2714858 RepID=A0A6M1SPE9_9HYPH|nr:type II toxin-antitoxin system ParD family antitoxin [Devosia aurantiaca]NGP18426.1 type II toxin-antitoxin system ParD family antitoxin [Devosia aurantiaca]